MRAARNKARREGHAIIRDVLADTDPCASARADILASRDAAMRVSGIRTLNDLRVDSEFFDDFCDKT